MIALKILRKKLAKLEKKRASITDDDHRFFDILNLDEGIRELKVSIIILKEDRRYRYYVR